MGLKSAEEYIRKLHKLQEDPNNWPDYLTGLPDRAAVVRKVYEIYPKIGKYTVSLVRISNIHTYLLKYGSSRHAEIIQWAAAILKTTASEYGNAFVGAAGTHEFAIICRAEDSEALLSRTRELFSKKTKSLYDKKDLKNNYMLSFDRDGKKVMIGLMGLVSASMEEKDVEASNVILTLAQRCSRLEAEGLTACEVS